MTRNPDGTFKTGDSETRESARKGGEASGGSRSQQQGQRHQKSSQQSQSSPDHDPRQVGDVATRGARKRIEDARNMRPADTGEDADNDQNENDSSEDEDEEER